MHPVRAPAVGQALSLRRTVRAAGRPGRVRHRRLPDETVAADLTLLAERSVLLPSQQADGGWRFLPPATLRAYGRQMLRQLGQDRSSRPDISAGRTGAVAATAPRRESNRPVIVATNCEAAMGTSRFAQQVVVG